MADTNLEEFWISREPESLGSSTSPVALQQWVSQQCRRLAEGMKSIHNYQYKQVPTDEPGGASEPRHGFHGDIKPANIFVYNSWIGHKSELGILPSHGLVVAQKRKQNLTYSPHLISHTIKSFANTPRHSHSSATSSNP